MVFDDGFTFIHSNEKDLPIIWDWLIMSESINLWTSVEDK